MNKDQFSWFASRVKKGKEGGRGSTVQGRPAGWAGKWSRRAGEGAPKHFKAGFCC